MSKKILYFTRGIVPTKDEAEAALGLGAVMRNGAAVGANDYVEKCDAVAGTVPAPYAGLPVADAVEPQGTDDAQPDAKRTKKTQ